MSKLDKNRDYGTFHPPLDNGAFFEQDGKPFNVFGDEVKPGQLEKQDDALKAATATAMAAPATLAVPVDPPKPAAKPKGKPKG